MIKEIYVMLMMTNIRMIMTMIRLTMMLKRMMILVMSDMATAAYIDPSDLTLPYICIGDIILPVLVLVS